MDPPPQTFTAAPEIQLLKEEKQLEFYLVVTNNTNEICLGRNDDEEFCFIGSFPLILSTDD